MPIYHSECKECGIRYREVRPISEYNKYPRCEACHGPTFGLILGAPMAYVANKFDAFKSYVDGSIIRNGKELEEHNKRNGVQNLHDGYDEAKILAGDLGAKRVEPTKEETLKDAIEAYNEVKNGYRPIIGAEDE